MEQQEQTSTLTSSRQGPIVVAVTLLTTSLVVGLLLMEVWYRIGVVNMGYEMTALTRERQNLLEEQKKLRIETTVNARTERLEQIARESLGLEPIRVDQVVKVRKPGVAALDDKKPSESGEPAARDL